MTRKTDPFAVELTPELILRAYQAGIFPMAEDAESEDLFWVSPQHRGIIPLDGFHVSQSLKKLLRHHSFTVKVDTDFPAIVNGCATEGSERDSTWINPAIRKLYGQLFDRGFVHTVEVWDGPALIGGLYGVSIGAAFFGESMFHRVTGASKIALHHLVQRLNAGGYCLLDTQFVTDNLKTFGGIEISREEYELRLAEAVSGQADWRAIERGGAMADPEQSVFVLFDERDAKLGLDIVRELRVCSFAATGSDAIIATTDDEYRQLLQAALIAADNLVIVFEDAGPKWTYAQLSNYAKIIPKRSRPLRRMLIVSATHSPPDDKVMRHGRFARPGSVCSELMR